MKCERSEGVGEAERRERDQSGWERPSVAMETGSYQLTPCFPLVPPPTADSPPFPSQSVHLSITPPSPCFFSFLSLSPSRPRPLSPFSPPLPPASPSGTSCSLHPPHPCFFPPHPLIAHWLHFHPLTLSFILFRVFFPPLFFTVAQIKPTTLHRIPRRRG